MNLTHLLSFVSVMKSVGSVILAVVILLAMVTIHEFGHYLAGKLLKFKINEFSVGFGPALLKKRSKKTGELFALRLIPLGGYCAFEGEEDTDEPDGGKAEVGGNAGKTPGPSRAASPERGGENVGEVFSDFSPSGPAAEKSDPQTAEGSGSAPVPDERREPAEERACGRPEQAVQAGAENADETGRVAASGDGTLKFNDQPPWKRIIVLVAGATMNYLLALLILVIMFTGLGRPRSYIMAAPSEEPAAGETAAEQSDSLLPDDIVLSLNGRDLYILTDYFDALDGKKAGDAVTAEVSRLTPSLTREERTLNLVLKADASFRNMTDTATLYAALGLDPEQAAIGFAYRKEGFWSSVGDSFVYSWKLGGTILRSLGELLTGKLGIDSMGGPVTTIRVTAEAASYNLYSFLNIAGFIGVNLAVFNLLPIPALDGSKVIFCIIEWIRKKPINRKVEMMIHFIGIIFLFGFAILVDLLQLF